MTEGDRIIIVGYHIKYDISSAQKQNSQSGSAIMVKGGNWRVPPNFSGTLEDNWITRTFDVEKIKGLLNNIVEKNLIRSF